MTAVPVGAIPERGQKLLVFADGVSATQHISFTQPLMASFQSHGLSLRLEKQSKHKADMEDLIKSEAPDYLVLSRYTYRSGASLATVARKRRAVTVFHIDDDLLNVPPSLGRDKYEMYNSPKLLSALRANMEAADLLYASTPALADAFRSYGLAVPIVAGDLYCTVDPDRIPAMLPATMPTIGYMGTGGHSEDLAMVMPAVLRLMDEMPDLRFETFGTISPPAELAAYGTRYTHHDPVGNYAAFVDHLGRLGWWIGLAPLVDNAFNRCKADTKWVEYSFAGVAAIVSDLPVYARACADGTALSAGSVEAWYAAMRRLLRDDAARRRQVEAARAKLRTTYTHDALRRQIIAILEEARVCAERRRA